MHQLTTPSLSQTIWPKWASKQFLTDQTLLPVTFGYSLSSEAVVMRQLSRWKRLWRRSLTRSHKRTSVEPSIGCCNGTTQVHCSRKRLLGRGLKFHVCTINEGAHTKKVWKLIVYPAYVYMCVWFFSGEHFDYTLILSYNSFRQKIQICDLMQKNQ